MSIPDAIRQIVRERAKFVCEYCHSPERLSASRFTLDHLIPVSLGGTDTVMKLRGLRQSVEQPAIALILTI
ncbi:MAG: HNH endonuclease [Pseudanabaenaceae cyanobacterium bins.39]|nr:HNH endonuclease [Pseudanabaenaceae cyanobacterium bins.39]